MIDFDSDITTFADRIPFLQVNPLSRWVPATGALYESRIDICMYNMYVTYTYCVDLQVKTLIRESK